MLLSGKLVGEPRDFVPSLGQFRKETLERM